MLALAGAGGGLVALCGDNVGRVLSGCVVWVGLG